jgi:cytochrome P450 family 103
MNEVATDGHPLRCTQDGATPIVLAEELEADPHTVCARYRTLSPVVARSTGGFVVLGAAEIEALLKDDRVRSAKAETNRAKGITDGPLWEFYRLSMQVDGPEHRKRRAPFTRTFALRLIEQTRPMIRALAHRLFDNWIQGRAVDFVDGFAKQLPALTIAQILGIPEQDIPHFTTLSNEAARVTGFNWGPEELPLMQESCRQMVSLVQQMLMDRRDRPREDFLSRYLAEIEIKADGLSAEEAVAQIVLLIAAGIETTRFAEVALVSLLMQHRSQWDAICRNPELAPRAVREALRFEPSVGTIVRVSAEPVAISGHVVPAGQLIHLSLLSASRDERVHQRSGEFDIMRDDLPRTNIGFGGGLHRCLGDSLALAELEESLIALTQRLPQLRMAGAPPQIWGHSGVRRIEGMQVVW